MSDPVVTVVAVEGHTVVRRHRTLDDAQNMRAILRASHAGVYVREGILSDIPDSWLDAARMAHEALKGDPAADLRRLATHERRFVLGAECGPLEEVDRG